MYEGLKCVRMISSNPFNFRKIRALVAQAVSTECQLNPVTTRQKTLTTSVRHIKMITVLLGRELAVFFNKVSERRSSSVERPIRRASLHQVDVGLVGYVSVRHASAECSGCGRWCRGFI